MSYTPSHLERIIRQNEGCVDQETVMAEIHDVVDSEAQKIAVERTITRRVHAMLKYVFGACQKKQEKRATAEKATAPLERLVSQQVSELGDPEVLMEEFAMDEVFDPVVAEALYVMEDTLHESKDPKKPAGAKETLRDLMKRREELARMAA